MLLPSPSSKVVRSPSARSTPKVLAPPSAVGRRVPSEPSGWKYQAVAVVPGGGNDVVRASAVGTGAPGWSGSPAPLSNSSRIGASRSYAARAASVEGWSRNRWSGSDTWASKISCMTSGRNSFTGAGTGASWSPTYRSRNVFHSTRFTGPNPSACAPFHAEKRVTGALVKSSNSSGKRPPVCSSW